MKLKKSKIQEVIEGLDPIIEHMSKAEENAKRQLEHVDSNYKKSAQNLIHYNTFRSYDIRGIQKKLKDLGLTRFANAEGHIMASLLTTRLLLGKLMGEGNPTSLTGTWSIRKGRRLLNGHTKDLLGYRSKCFCLVTCPRPSSSVDYCLKKCTGRLLRSYYLLEEVD
ncbi:MAG: hypothetical protein AAGA66_19010 [Bacteroidota bacterium]